MCGAVTFTAREVGHHVHACHCSMCRRWTGSPMMAAEAAGVEFTGTENIGRYDSSEWAERGFCSRCGTSLFYRLKAADKYIMSIGAFDDQSAFELVGEIYIDEKPPGYNFAGEHPRQTGAEFMESLQE
ncbi:MAG: GFA family protein [Pseudomonadales bacterium]